MYTTHAHIYTFTQHNEEPAEQSPIATQGSKSQQFQASAKPIQARPDNQAPHARAPAGGGNRGRLERTLHGSTESSGCPAACRGLRISRSFLLRRLDRGNCNRFCRLQLQPRTHGTRALDRCPGGSKKHRWRRLHCLKPHTTNRSIWTHYTRKVNPSTVWGSGPVTERVNVNRKTMHLL